MNNAETALIWIANQIPDFEPKSKEDKMLLVIKQYCTAGADEIARLTAENAELHARLEKAVELPCVDKEDWYYTVKFPARVEDEIFIINKEKNSILSAAVNNIVSYDESGKEWIFSIRYDCEGCDKYGECDYFDCPSKNCIWGDMDIPHGDNEYVVGYTGVNLSDYNKTWFTDRAKAEARLAELKGGERE